jgi:hypothetical protein
MIPYYHQIQVNVGNNLLVPLLYHTILIILQNFLDQKAAKSTSTGCTRLVSDYGKTNLI